MYHKYFVYIDDGKNVFKIAIAAKDKDAATILCEGQGEVIAVKDVTEDYHIDITEVRRALINAGFDIYKTDFVCRFLVELEIAGTQ